MKAPYRDDRYVLEARREEIARRLSELEAHRRQAQNLNVEENALRQELFGIEQRMGAQDRRVSLANLKVASPCSARWDDMVGDERVRFCGSCAKNVYNLSALPKEDAEALLVEKEGKLCVRYFQRADGTVLTADCPVGVKKKRVRRLAILAVGVGAAGAATAAAFGFGATRCKPTMGATTGETMGQTEAMPLITGVAPPPVEPSPTHERMGGPMPLPRAPGRPK